LAEGFFAHKQPELAVPEYEKFLVISSKTTSGRERALYHLAESQRLMGSTLAAEASFQRLLQENLSGEYKVPTEFRLGELNEASGNLILAADFFAHAALDATDPSIQQAAHFREALCREKSGQKDQSRILFEAMTKGSRESPNRIPSLLHLAASALESGNKIQALAWYSQILSSKTSEEIFSEAAVKSALLQTDLGNKEEAKTLFEKVANSKGAGNWRPIAALALVRIASQSGDNTSVLKAASIALASDSDDKPEIFLLQANAFRKLGKNSQALADYDRIIREYPGSKAASLAPFQRLLTLHATHADSLLSEIDQYLLTASDPNDRARAQLLKAEETLHKGQFKDAATLYHQIDTTVFPPATKTDILYKESWALIQAGEKEEGSAALTRFLEIYPQDERAPAALAQRALLKQQKSDLPGALADFSQLDQQYPKAAERELALQQKALLLGQQQDNKGMVEAFTLLLHDYPSTTAAPQAHYWMGWTALENKDYATAVTELAKARTADPKQFAERAGLRILLADYYLNQPDAASREAMALNPSMVPSEVGRWLGLKAMESGNPAKAEHFLTPLIKEGLPGSSDTELQATLAAALIAQGKFSEAQAPATICLKLSHDPASRARALLTATSIQRAMKNLSEASSMIDEVMLLQPEGSINAEARIMSGDLLLARQNYSDAAKAYITVAVLTDDPILTPKALSRAITAYRLSGNKAEAQKTLDELSKRFPKAPLPAPPKS
jgi:TolA-binding protein